MTEFPVDHGSELIQAYQPCARLKTNKMLKIAEFAIYNYYISLYFCPLGWVKLLKIYHELG